MFGYRPDDFDSHLDNYGNPGIWENEMPKNETAKYDIDVSITLIERDQYGNELVEGSIHYRAKTTVYSLAGAGALLQDIESAIKGKHHNGGI